MRQKLLSITQTLRLPSICLLCNQFHTSKLAVCHFCITLITPLGPACEYCAHPLPDPYPLICGSCIKEKPDYDRAYIGYTFEEPLRGLLHQFKYQNGLVFTRLLGHLMLTAVPQYNPNDCCLVPVPMHPTRLRQRGFNQAAVLTVYLAQQLQLPYLLNACKKIRNTAPQASLDAEARQNNLRTAFVTSILPYSHVILIDDLLTTGNTASELARVLKQAGVKQVDIWCCARTVFR